MKKQKWERVINVASTASLKTYPYVTAYSAAKQGVIGLTHSVALKTAKAGITINTICPGYIETVITESAIENINLKTAHTKAEEAREELLKTIHKNALFSLRKLQIQSSGFVKKNQLQSHDRQFRFKALR